MNINAPRSLAAVLVIAALAQPAIAETRGEHPAVLVSRSWTTHGIDPNTFIVQHPAGHAWVSGSSTAKLAKAEPALLRVKAASVTAK
jgi:hypothetical protein